MTKIVPAAATALALLLLPALASAEPGQGNGRGLIVRGEDGWRFCPPGLARREPACVPPGQARQMISDEEREQRRAQRRAERQAERRAAAEEAEAEKAAEARSSDAERELDLAASEDKSEALGSVLTALLAPEPRAVATTEAPARATPIVDGASAPQPVRVAEDLPLHEALQRAAAMGQTGY